MSERCVVDRVALAAKMRPMIDAPRGNFIGRVLSNTTLCREHYRLTIAIPDFPPSRPGQFVQLSCRDHEADRVDHEFEWSPDATRPTIEGREFQGSDAFLRRPFSIAGRRDDADGNAEIDIIGREIGPGTRFLAQMKVGNALGVIGPLGNTFTLEGDMALLVGGGVGIPPMIYLAQALFERAREEDSTPRALAFAGALTQALLPLTLGPRVQQDAGADSWPRATHRVAEFHQFEVPAILTTDDGSFGQRGYVTDALERYIDKVLDDAAARARTIIYTCGPELMMKRVQQIAESRGIRCQIAVERAMACGMGTCQSCCIRVKKPHPEQPPLPGKTWCYRLACTDGPVFSGDELLW